MTVSKCNKDDWRNEWRSSEKERAKQERQAEGCEHHHDTHTNVWMWSLEFIEEAAVKGVSHADEGVV